MINWFSFYGIMLIITEWSLLQYKCVKNLWKQWRMKFITCEYPLTIKLTSMCRLHSLIWVIVWGLGINKPKTFLLSFRLVIKNMLMGYLLSPRNKQPEVLRAVGGILGFTEEDFNKVPFFLHTVFVYVHGSKF